MAIVSRLVSSNWDGLSTDGPSTLTIVYDDEPQNVPGPAGTGLIIQRMEVHNTSTYGFWVGMRSNYTERTSQRIFSPMLDEAFFLPQGLAARFWFVVRPDGKLDGIGFETGFVPWTGERQKGAWP